MQQLLRHEARAQDKRGLFLLVAASWRQGQRVGDDRDGGHSHRPRRAPTTLGHHERPPTTTPILYRDDRGSTDATSTPPTTGTSSRLRGGLMFLYSRANAATPHAGRVGHLLCSTDLIPTVSRISSEALLRSADESLEFGVVRGRRQPGTYSISPFLGADSSVGNRSNPTGPKSASGSARCSSISAREATEEAMRRPGVRRRSGLRRNLHGSRRGWPQLRHLGVTCDGGEDALRIRGVRTDVGPVRFSTRAGDVHGDLSANR